MSPISTSILGCESVFSCCTASLAILFSRADFSVAPTVHLSVESGSLMSGRSERCRVLGGGPLITFSSGRGLLSILGAGGGFSLLWKPVVHPCKLNQIKTTEPQNTSQRYYAQKIKKFSTQSHTTGHTTPTKCKTLS